jgi:hypothetical protein
MGALSSASVRPFAAVPAMRPCSCIPDRSPLATASPEVAEASPSEALGALRSGIPSQARPFAPGAMKRMFC